MSDKDKISNDDISGDLAAALRDLRAPGVSDALMDRIAGDAAALSSLEAARRAPPVPSDLLMARIVRDAEEQRPRGVKSLAPWAALMAAGVAGLAIGLSDPERLMEGAWPGRETVAMTTLVPAYEFQYLELE